MPMNLAVISQVYGENRVRDPQTGRLEKTREAHHQARLIVQREGKGAVVFRSSLTNSALQAQRLVEVLTGPLIWHGYPEFGEYDLPKLIDRQYLKYVAVFRELVL